MRTHELLWRDTGGVGWWLLECDILLIFHYMVRSRDSLAGSEEGVVIACVEWRVSM